MFWTLRASSCIFVHLRAFVLSWRGIVRPVSGRAIRSKSSRATAAVAARRPGSVSRFFFRSGNQIEESFRQLRGRQKLVACPRFFRFFIGEAVDEVDIVDVVD